MKISIGLKLTVGFGIALAAMAAIVFFNNKTLTYLARQQDDGVTHTKAESKCQEYRRVGYKLYTVVADAQLNGYNEEAAQRFKDFVKEGESVRAYLANHCATKEEKEWIKEAGDEEDRMITLFLKEMVPILPFRQNPEIASRINSLDDQIDKALKASQVPLRKLSEKLLAEATEADKEFDETTQASIRQSLILASIGLLLSLLVGVLIARAITVPMKAGVAFAHAIAGGDLTRPIEEKYRKQRDEVGELATALDGMHQKLVEIVSGVANASSNVSSGSEQLSGSSEELSQGASEQSASVEEVSASVEQMTSTIRQNADNAAQTEKIAIKSAQDAKNGGEAVSRTVAAMKSIADKVSIIQEIARQTNLLSLNASIEAARAGEHGKGFAVVASEVQKLAERSQQAAGEIGELSKSSVDVAEQAGTMLGKLVPDIQKTADLVSEINAASAEQNNGAQQINNAMQQLSSVVQQNASAAEQMAATSEELASQAVSLKETIGFFRVREEGARSLGATSRRPRLEHRSAPKKPLAPGNTGLTPVKSPGVKINLGAESDREDGDFRQF